MYADSDASVYRSFAKIRARRRAALQAPKIPKRSPQRAPSPSLRSNKSSINVGNPPDLHISLPPHLGRTDSNASSDGSTYSQNEPVSARSDRSPAGIPLNLSNTADVVSQETSLPAAASPTELPLKRAEKSSGGSSHNRKTSVVNLDDDTNVLRSPKQEGFVDEGRRDSFELSSCRSN